MATAKKMSKAEKVRAYQAQHPTATTAQVAKATGADIGYIYAIRHKDKGSAAKTPKVPKQLKWRHVTVAPMDEALEGIARLEAATRLAEAQHITMIEPPADNVNHPSHYKVGGIETIDFIEAKLTPEEFRGYLRGNMLKYLSRAGSKGNYEEDMLKARWYLNRETAKFGK
jgi:prolyl-tRNA editing enzyme YbaK/EbsC (Cys-tRNA(Pro) deacylase)